MARHPLGDSVVGHLRDVLETNAASPGAKEARPAAEGPPTEAAIAPLTRLGGRFTVERRLGLGGMGAVYLAYDHEREEPVALKVVHAGDPSLDVRFEREARSLESIVHPWVVRHIAHGVTQEGTWFLATEPLAGGTLRERLRDGVLDVEETIVLGARIAEALGAVHARGLVHRDLTPNNVLLCEDGSVRLLDFGLTSIAGGSHSLTGQGGVVGTVGYMSPEQARGAAIIDTRADVFSLGCLLTHCLTGGPPFGNAVAEVLTAMSSDVDPTRALPEDTPADLRELLGEMLAMDPARRPGDGRVVAAALRRMDRSVDARSAFARVSVRAAPDAPARAFTWIWGNQPMVTVAVRLAFLLEPGVARLAPDPQALRPRDEHRGGDLSRSVFQPSDLAPYKTRSDVVVVGHAFAPNQVPLPRIRARVRVGAVDKAVIVSGPSSPSLGGATRPVARGALSYEHAACGMGNQNPVGVAAGASDPIGGPIAPSVHAETAPAGTEGPGGLGPIAPDWPMRRALLPPGLDPWLHGAPATIAWPKDDDGRFFNCAPDDQQLSTPLAADQLIELDNLHPEHASLSSRLPGVRPRVFLRWPSGHVTEVPVQADTLWIDTDRGLCTLTFRGSFALGKAQSNLQLATTLDGPGISPGEPDALFPDEAPGMDALISETLAARPDAVTAKRVAPPTASPTQAGEEHATRRTIERLDILWSEPGAPSLFGEDPRAPGERGALLDATALGIAELEALLLGSLGGGAPGHAGGPRPLASVGGRLELPFDDGARLEAMIAVCTPDARASQPLREALEDARALFAGGRLPAVEAVANATRRLTEVLAHEGRAAPNVERTLLEHRDYQRRRLFGRDVVRGVLHLERGGMPVPLYLPTEAAECLPLVSTVDVRALVELRPAQDPLDPANIALRAVALGRRLHGFDRPQ